MLTRRFDGWRAATGRALILVSLVVGPLAGCDQSGPAAPAPEATAAADVPETPATTPPATTPPATPVTTAEPEPPKPLDPNVPPVRLTPEEIQVGEVEPLSRHEGTFILTNYGDRPVTVENIRSSCKCTAVSDLTGVTIQPGAGVPIVATLDMPATPGPKDGKVYVRFAGYEKTALTALMQGEVVMAVQSSPGFVDALRQTDGQIKVYSRDGQPFRILSSNGETPDVVAWDPETGGARNTFTVNWDVADMPCEGMRMWWIIETDRADCPILPVRIRHPCTGGRADPGRRTRRWIFKEYVVNAGNLVAGQAVELDVDLENRDEYEILRAQSLDPNAEAELIGFEHTGTGETACKIRFTPAADHRGMLYAMVEFQSVTGDGRVAVVGSVKE